MCLMLLGCMISKKTGKQGMPCQNGRHGDVFEIYNIATTKNPNGTLGKVFVKSQSLTWTKNFIEAWCEALQM